MLHRCCSSDSNAPSLSFTGPGPGSRAGLVWLAGEFMAWSASADVEPVLCLNMGTGTLDEALAWVEYCNGTGDTYWAGLRRANGHAEPYRVRHWGLGNEMYGDWQIGQRTAADVTAARQWAKALKLLDPSICLVSCGQTGVDDWDRVVIEGLAPTDASKRSTPWPTRWRSRRT